MIEPVARLLANNRPVGNAGPGDDDDDDDDEAPIGDPPDDDEGGDWDDDDDDDEEPLQARGRVIASQHRLWSNIAAQCRPRESGRRLVRFFLIPDT